MNEFEIIKRIVNFKNRLCGEVLDAYEDRGEEYGSLREDRWRQQFEQFLKANLPKAHNDFVSLNRPPAAYFVRGGETDAERFIRETGNKWVAFIDSLIDDINNGEFDFSHSPPAPETPEEKSSFDMSKVFIVHGHDHAEKLEVARLIEKLGFKAIILSEQASGGQTIIEKLEANTDVGFAIVIYTPDDQGNSNAEASQGNYNGRARQNVVFEHGYLIGKLGRPRVATLMIGEVEMPSDVGGVVYVNKQGWELRIAKEMRAAGYQVDLNKL